MELSVGAARGRDAVTVDGAGVFVEDRAAEASAGVGAAVSWPPKVRPPPGWELWIAICRWNASSALLIGCADDGGRGSEFG